MLQRRIAAIVLPSLVCELAREPSLTTQCLPERSYPLAVLLDDEGDSVEAVGTDIIDAVDDAAYAAGVRPGQRVSEAAAFSAHLTIAHVKKSRVFAALATVAEVALSFGVVAHVEPLDAIWLDVSGVAHLFGGEAQLLAEIEARISSLGFRTNVAIADGPRIAEALARHRGRSGALSIAPIGRGAEALAPLSIGALPLGEEARSLFIRLGVLTVADFARLPRAQVVTRLSSISKRARRSSTQLLAAEASAVEVMALAMGHDPMPLEPYEAPAVLVEEQTFDDGVETAPQLLFVLRAMVSRLSARLLGRAQATNRIEMTIAYDRSIFRLRTENKSNFDTRDTASRSSEEAAPCVETIVELPAPLAHEGDLLRAFKAKLEQIVLVAPAVGLRLALSRVVAAPRVQLDLSRDVTVSPDALPALLSELSAEIGASALGVLSLASSYRPEARSVLVPVSEAVQRKAPEKGESEWIAGNEEPARLLPEAVLVRRSIGASSDLGRGNQSPNLGGAILGSTTLKKNGEVAREPIFIGNEPFEIVRIVFDRRLDGIEWWASQPASRDYLRVLLASSRSPKTTSSKASSSKVGSSEKGESLFAEAWIYVDRVTGESFLQGWWE